MSEIALYNALTKLGLNHDEAKEAVADVASSKNIATKADLVAEMAKLETKLIEKIAQQEARMTWKMIALGVAIVGVIKYFG